MARAKPIAVPDTVPELQALVAQFIADQAARREKKASAMARWRGNRKKRVTPTAGDQA